MVAASTGLLLYLKTKQKLLQINNSIMKERTERKGGGGGGFTPIYKLYGYVPHFRVWFTSCFSLK